jgi:WhiB family transcriptional regulator, redox-sensing transcriptional regulator
MTERRWQDRAACAGLDPDLWFPEPGGDTATAKAICAGCPVRWQCYDYAQTRPEKHGIWGGFSARERRDERRRTREGAA